MRILLLGECSNVHWNLSKGLRELGHEVQVVSHKNWMQYKNDISLTRKSNGLFNSICYLFKLLTLIPTWKNFDIVQINNLSYFVLLKVNRNYLLYKYLKKHNKKVFMAGYATDFFYIKACIQEYRLRYSEFQIGKTLIRHEKNLKEIEDWLYTNKKEINIQIADNCNGIPTCLYEYYVAYKADYPNKTEFLPLPIDLSTIKPKEKRNKDNIRFFIGIQTDRTKEKGTDIMFRALQRIHDKYPNECEIVKAESVPFPIYQDLMNSSDILLDQLYSYTPSMNALLAMAKGLVVVGGGEPENYEILNEKELRPIINVLPNEEDVFNKLEDIILHKERIPILSAQSIAYVKKHHDCVKVAQQYLDFWNVH